MRFARSGDIDIAYHVVGDGPVDLVYVEGAYTQLEVSWELPQYRRWSERLGEFTRLIRFDKRGLGMSDRVRGATTLEERMDDIRAVMDAVGSERAALIGESEGGPLSMLFAAAHPERTVGSSSRARRCGSAESGLHTGEVELADDKVAGIAVNVGARIAARADAGEVLVSGTVRDLVAGSGLAFEDRGTAELKGVPGEWRIFAVQR